MFPRIKWLAKPKLEMARKSLDFFIEGSYLAAVFLTPLWFSYWLPTYNIFELNKFCIFQILLFLLFFFVAFRLIFFPLVSTEPVSKFFKKYWLAPTVFILGLSLTLISSSNPVLSFYGSIERALGLRSYLLFYLWFILLVSAVLITSSVSVDRMNINIQKKIRRIMIAAVISGSLVSLYGILQVFNIDFLSWPEAPYLTGRTFSSFGQPNFLASWLLFVIPSSFYLFFSTRRHWIKFLYFLAFTAQLICLFLTGSRGGLIALLLAGGAVLAWLFFLMAWPKRKKILASIFFLALAIISLAGLDYLSHGRVRDLAQFNMGSFGARVNLYHSAVEAISSRPFFGYGIDASREVFIKYYEPDWGIYGQVSQSADRAHNLFLDILLASGIFGLILYVILYGHFFKIIQANIKDSRQRFLSLSLGFGLIAYLFSLLFSFTIVAGEIYVWLFFALFTLVDYSNEPAINQPIPLLAPATAWSQSPIKTRLVKTALASVSIILVCFPIYQVVQTLAADYDFNKIYLYIPVPDYEEVLHYYDKLETKKINPVYRAEYDSFLGDKLSGLYASINDSAIKSEFQERLQGLVLRLPDQGYLNLYAKAKLYRVLGEYSKAQEHLDKLIELTPHWPLVYIEQAYLSAAQNDIKGTMVAYYLTLLNLPDSNDPRLNDDHLKDVVNYKYFVYKSLAEIAFKQQDYVLAEKYYQQAYKNKPDDYTLLKKIADTYYLRGDLATAIKYNRHGFERSSQDYTWPLALAILYRESGDNRQASYYLEQALKLEPNNDTLKKLKIEYGK